MTCEDVQVAKQSVFDKVTLITRLSNQTRQLHPLSVS